jgi:hypothetical protein
MRTFAHTPLGAVAFHSDLGRGGQRVLPFSAARLAVLQPPPLDPPKVLKTGVKLAVHPPPPVMGLPCSWTSSTSNSQSNKLAR